MCWANPKSFETWKKRVFPVSQLVDHCWIAVLAAVVQMALGHKASGICAWTSSFGKHTLEPIKFQGEKRLSKSYEMDDVSGQVPGLQLQQRPGSWQVKSRVQAGSSQAVPGYDTSTAHWQDQWPRDHPRGELGLLPPEGRGRDCDMGIGDMEHSTSGFLWMGAWGWFLPVPPTPTALLLACSNMQRFLLQ